MRLRIPGKYWEPQRVASSQTEIAAEILETLGMHKVSAPAVSKAIGIPIGPPFASNLKRNHPSEIKHPTSHTITKNSFAAQPKNIGVWAPLSETKKATKRVPRAQIWLRIGPF